MKRFLAALALLAVLATSTFAAAPPFPFRTYDEATAAVTDPPRPACENGGIRVGFGDEWVAFSWPDRDLFIHYTNGSPDYVYLIVGQSGGTMTVKAVLTLEQAKQRFRSPCAYGDEKQI